MQTYKYEFKNRMSVTIDPVSSVIDMSFLSPIEYPKYGFKVFHEAIDNFLSNNKNSIITINIKIKIIDSGSTSEILKMFKKFKQYSKDLKLIINWYYIYDDDESLTFGKDLEFISDLKFNFIPYQE